MARARQTLRALRTQLDARLGVEGPVSWLGNGCGHVVKELRPAILPDQRRPPLIPRLIKRIGGPHGFYYKPWKKRLRVLAYIRARRMNAQVQRLMRSERREAVVAVLGVLLHYCDLLTMRVGFRDPNFHQCFVGLNMTTIARYAGLSLSRADRAMQDLKAAGLVGVYPIVEKRGNRNDPRRFLYTGKAAIRTINPGLFEVYGLGADLKDYRAKLYKKLKSVEEYANELAAFHRGERNQPPTPPKRGQWPDPRKLLRQILQELGYDPSREPKLDRMSEPAPPWIVRGDRDPPDTS